MQPLNDLCKIKLDTDEFGFGGGDKDTAESGVLVELPNIFNYYGGWSFFFERSFMAREELEALLAYWSTKIGRRVYWTALSERGNVLVINKEKFCFVKLTSLIAESDPEVIATNVHGDGQGAFKA